MIFYVSIINYISVLASSMLVYADVYTNSAKLVLTPNKVAAEEAQQKSSQVSPIAKGKAIAITSENNIMNQTKIGSNNTIISGQFIITLKDEVTRSPKGLEDTLDSLSAKVLSEGAKVIYVYKYSTKGLAIKVPNQQVLEKLLSDLKKDPRIANIEPDKSVQAS